MPRSDLSAMNDWPTSSGAKCRPWRGRLDVPDGSASSDSCATAYSAEEALRPLAFAACYVYSPRGRGAIATASRVLRARLKSGDPGWLACYAARVWQLRAGSGRYACFFGPDVVLVPVPRSRPHAPNVVWVAERLAMALVGFGLAGGIWTGLRRSVPVRKSATSLSGERPTVAAHYGSLVAAQPPDGPNGECPVTLDRLLLVDDVVTKGRTLLAAAARLREVCPASEVRGFALARTLGLVRGIEHLVSPCEGEIFWSGGDARRAP